MIIGYIGAFVLWILKGRKTELGDEIESSYFEFKHVIVGFITLLVILFLFAFIYQMCSHS